MPRFTRAQARLHDQAEALLEQDVLSDEDREFVLAHWREDASP